MPDRFLLHRKPLADAAFAALISPRTDLHGMIAAARLAVASQCRVPAEMLYPEDESKALMNLAPDDWDDLYIPIKLEEILGRPVTKGLPRLHGWRFLWWGRPGPKSLGEWCEQVAACMQRQEVSRGERQP